MIDSKLIDSKKEYDKFLWIPKRVEYKWVWLKYIHVIEQDIYMVIEGKPAVVKKVTYKLKEE